MLSNSKLNENIFLRCIKRTLIQNPIYNGPSVASTSWYRLIFVPNFEKIGQLIQNLKRDPQKQHVDVMTLFISSRKESRLNTTMLINENIFNFVFALVCMYSSLPVTQPRIIPNNNNNSKVISGSKQLGGGRAACIVKREHSIMW